MPSQAILYRANALTSPPETVDVTPEPPAIAPVAAWTWWFVGEQKMHFDAGATKAQLDATYAWTFGDTTTGSGRHTEHQYPSGVHVTQEFLSTNAWQWHIGVSYNVSLTVTDAYGTSTSGPLAIPERQMASRGHLGQLTSVGIHRDPDNGFWIFSDENPSNVDHQVSFYGGLDNFYLQYDDPLCENFFLHPIDPRYGFGDPAVDAYVQQGWEATVIITDFGNTTVSDPMTFTVV